jgi:hypothetical protein
VRFTAPSIGYSLAVAALVSLTTLLLIKDRTNAPLD